MSVVDKIQLRRNGPFYDIRDNSKSPLDHTHDDRYYTETEVDSMESDIYTAINSKLPLSGGTVTGNLTVNSNIYGDVGHGIQTGGLIRQDIPANSNLNGYIRPGFYKCSGNVIAQTVLNCPTTLSFTLDVINATGHSPDATNYQYLTQKLITYTNDIFLRKGQGDYGGTITWESWGLIAYRGNTVVARPSYESSIDQVYDASSFITTSSSSGTFPSGATKYGAGLTLPYRKPYGNAKPDFAGQIFIPNGDSTPDSMYFRTSKASTWDTWQKVLKASDFTSGQGSGYVNPSPTTLTDILTISMPTGWKILTVGIIYNHSEPLDLAFGNASYIIAGQTSKLSGKVCQKLMLTTLTDQDSIHVYARWGTNAENSYTYKYTTLPI